MWGNGKAALGRYVWAAPALMVLAGLGAARADGPLNAHSLAPAIKASAPVVAAPLHLAPTKPPRSAALNPNFVPTVSGCTARREFTRFDHPLLHTALRLASGKPLVIVAIGSSSTAGAGASSPAASYPSRLAAELKDRLRGHVVKVVNRGVNGEVVSQMMARFASGVVAERPQLVLWQLGTNSVLRNRPLQPHSRDLLQGIEELKNIGADVVLIDPQYAPRVIAKPETPSMVDQIAIAARDEDVDLFHRFGIMRDWYVTQHRSFDVFVSPDGLHMNDWGYACWAKLLAASVVQAANPPVASAMPGAVP
ncbi:MAG: SGNH/GDSL hydrolase family protein [Xanthobacteraceae bacterium]